MVDNNGLFSTMVRAGRTTFFVDVKEAKNGNRYIAITENRLNAENQKERTTVRVFGHAIDQLRQAVCDAAAAVVTE